MGRATVRDTSLLVCETVPEMEQYRRWWGNPAFTKRRIGLQGWAVTTLITPLVGKRYAQIVVTFNATSEQRAHIQSRMYPGCKPFYVTDPDNDA